ncbi:MAG: prepilin-type N-terminal cleavage/methylation domain-containing protein [Myxococcales bacterium]|nr:prepilin-type N-terminal cleavage/methylation domain-containing protein [Myxococcales bacterium]
MRRGRPRGFTLVEVMLTLAILSVMAQIALNEFRSMIMMAKRTEAILGLAHVWKAQKAYQGRQGTYSPTFQSLDFAVVGGKLLTPAIYKGARYTYQLSQPWGPQSFYCIATAQLDGDEWPDILEILEKDPNWSGT